MAAVRATAPPERAPPELIRRLRRLALERQGLTRLAAFGRGLGGTARAVERLGWVQIDTISVVGRAHHHVLQARVPGYRPALLERLQREHRVFEYWAHAAAYLPMRDYRFAIPRMRDVRERRESWVRSRDRTLMREVLERVRVDGPLQVRDFEAPPGQRAGWWEWKPAKRALEQLFMEGDLMVIGRVGFQKVYDLPERVLPDWVDTREPTLQEYARHLVERHVEAFGFASVRACAYLRRTPGLPEAVHEVLEAARQSGSLQRFAVPPPERDLYVDVRALEAPVPAVRRRAALLSPFDNLVILRHRCRTLFGLDYQLECYLPAEKRRFGYYCLPVLYHDRLIGRADCKAHRSIRALEVKRLFVEREHGLDREADAVLAALVDALAALAQRNGCDRVQVADVQPRRWLAPLQRALAEYRGSDLQTANGLPARARETDATPDDEEEKR
ncbi:MAG TPA: crosslink repair DNA glycosylase YcaQ family protein [Pseudomonadales bacterium]